MILAPSLKIENANLEDLGVFKSELEAMGVKFEQDGNIQKRHDAVLLPWFNGFVVNINAWRKYTSCLVSSIHNFAMPSALSLKID